MGLIIVPCTLIQIQPIKNNQATGQEITKNSNRPTKSPCHVIHPSNWLYRCYAVYNQCIHIHAFEW